MSATNRSTSQRSYLTCGAAPVAASFIAPLGPALTAQNKDYLN